MRAAASTTLGTIAVPVLQFSNIPCSRDPGRDGQRMQRNPRD